MSVVTKTFEAKAIAAHGHECPAWILALAKACDIEGFVKPVAAIINYSHSAVSATINGSYTGKLDHIREAVEMCLMSATVQCPVLGEIPAKRCHKYQSRKKLKAVHPTDIALWKACNKTCTNKRGAL